MNKYETIFLKKKRIDNSKTIQEVAKALNISTGSYSNKENGRNEFTMKEFVELCKTLKINRDEIWNVFFI